MYNFFINNILLGIFLHFLTFPRSLALTFDLSLLKKKGKESSFLKGLITTYSLLYFHGLIYLCIKFIS